MTIIVLVTLILIVFLIPARFDPAIHLKEWNERQ